MLGRAVTSNPYTVAMVDEIMNQHFLCDTSAPAAPPPPTRSEALLQYGQYLATPPTHSVNTSIHHLVRPVVHLFHNCGNAKSFRRLLMEEVEATVRSGDTGPIAAGDIVMRVCDQLDVYNSTAR